MFTYLPTEEERQLAKIDRRIANLHQAITALDPITTVNLEDLVDHPIDRAMQQGGLLAIETMRETIQRLQDERALVVDRIEAYRALDEALRR